MSKRSHYWTIMHRDIDVCHPDVHIVGRTKKDTARLAMAWWNTYYSQPLLSEDPVAYVRKHTTMRFVRISISEVKRVGGGQKE